jgi:hypothetical protein
MDKGNSLAEIHIKVFLKNKKIAKQSAKQVAKQVAK